MKTRRFIFRKLISGKVKLTPEVLRGLKELGNGEGAAIAPPKPGEFMRPKQSGPPASNIEPRCDAKRLVFVSLLPGRWVRCAGAAVAYACLFLPGTTFAASGQEAFNAASAAFAHGNFADAARGFESLLARNGYSAAVLYNLANAQFQDGKVGAAILNYERALALAPNDPEIAANLKLARTKAGVPTSDLSGGARITNQLSLNGWATLAVGALLVVCAAVPLRRQLPRPRVALGLTGALATVAFLVALSATALRGPDLDRAVVTTRHCIARISPVTMGETLFTVSEGDAVTTRRTRGDFTLIESRDGRFGWVNSGDIGQVMAGRQK